LQIHDELDALVDPMLFVGRAPEQVDEFMAEEIDPVLAARAELLAIENKDGVSV
jgi:adenylosuccinate lyase